MTTNAIHLPEFAEWISSDIYNDHIGNHGQPWDQPAAVEGCPGCLAQMWLPDIHAFYMGKATDTQFDHLYSLSDGYGIIGFIPDQGYDWSGIRDSSPAAVRRMYDYVVSCGVAACMKREEQRGENR